MNFKNYILLFMISALVATTSKAYAREFNPDDKIPIDSKIKIGKLENGFTYYIRQNQRPEKQAHFRLVINAGAINEDDDQNGLAHFIEHMCFNGTKNFPKNELVDFLQKTGIRFGADLNASTNTDVTMYELPIPMNDPELLKNTFMVLQDWAHNVSFDNDQIEGERGVIISEWRQRNNFQMRLRNKHADKLYNGSKYADRNIIGDTAIIQNAPREAFTRFYKDWYRPDLMALIAVGDFDVNEIEKMIKSHFSNLKMPENPRERVNYKIPDHKNSLVSIATDKELPVDIGILYFKKQHSDEKFVKDFKERLESTLYDIMFNGRISEFQQKPNPPFIQAGGSYGSFAGDKDAYFIQVVTKTGEIENGLDAVLTEAHRVRLHGFTATELDRAKKQYISQLEQAYKDRNTRESNSYVNEYTRNFTRKESIPGIEYELELSKSLIDNIDLSNVNSLAKAYISKENTVLTIGAVDKVGSTPPSETKIQNIFYASWEKQIAPYKDEYSEKPLFSKIVAPGKIIKEKEDKYLGLYQFELSNGAQIIVKPTDFDDTEILFRAYSNGGTSVASDLDYVSASLADQFIAFSGIGEFSNPDLQKVLSDKNVNVSPQINDLSAELSGNSVPDDIETMMQLIHLYFTAVRTDKDASTSYLQRLRSVIENRMSVPENIFNDSIQVILSSWHYRQRPPSTELLNEFNYDKALEFYKNRYADASNFTFIFVGNIDLNTFKPFVEKYIASLPSNGQKENWKDIGLRYPNGEIERRIKKGDEDKSHVRLTYTGTFDWSQECRFELTSLADVVRIRMTDLVREQLGGTYSPGIWVQFSKYPVPMYSLNVDFVCEPKRVDELISATDKLLKELKKDVDIESTQKVVKAMKLQREKNLKNNRYWITNLYSYLINNDDPSQILKYDKLVENLKAEIVRKAAKEYIDFENKVTVILEPENS